MLRLPPSGGLNGPPASDCDLKRRVSAICSRIAVVRIPIHLSPTAEGNAMVACACIQIIFKLKIILVVAPIS